MNKKFLNNLNLLQDHNQNATMCLYDTMIQFTEIRQKVMAEHTNKKLLSFTKLMSRVFYFFKNKTFFGYYGQWWIIRRREKKKRPLIKYQDHPKVTTDNQQVTINLKFPKPRILHNPQQVHLVTLRVQRLVQSKKNEVRLGSFKQLTRELTKDFAAQSVAAKVDFSLDYIVKNKRVYKGFSHLFKHSLQ